MGRRPSEVGRVVLVVAALVLAGCEMSSENVSSSGPRTEATGPPVTVLAQGPPAPPATEQPAAASSGSLASSATALPVRSAPQAVPPLPMVTRPSTTRPPSTRAPTTTAPPSAAPPSACHPSYRGACLPPDASDVDCAGGRGNGPFYTGRVEVVGPDVFDLDRDGDGVGCEKA